MAESPYRPLSTEPQPPPLPGEKTAWNAWWTWLWALVLIVFWQILMAIGVMIAILSSHLGDPSIPPGQIAQELERFGTDGDVIGLVTFSTIFLICPLCWLIGNLREGWTGWEYLGQSKVKWWQWPLWGFATIACTLLFSLVAPSLGITEPDKSMVSLASSTQFPLLLYLGVGIGAPLVEEFIFRGVLFRGWRESRIGLWGTIILTSFCWAILHVQYPPIIMAYIFTLGLVLGFAREKTSSLWVPVFMHALNNGLATLEMLSY